MWLLQMCLLTDIDITASDLNLNSTVETIKHNLSFKEISLSGEMVKSFH